jgi:hypothetical protein
LGADQQGGRASQPAKQRGSPTMGASINRGLQHFKFSDFRSFSAGSKYLWLCTIDAVGHKAAERCERKNRLRLTVETVFGRAILTKQKRTETPINVPSSRFRPQIVTLRTEE